MIRREETVKTQTVTIEHIHCDDCDARIKMGTYRSGMCDACGKDLCDKCVANLTYDGDYQIVHCSECWGLGEPYRKKIEELERVIDKLDDEYRQVCAKHNPKNK